MRAFLLLLAVAFLAGPFSTAANGGPVAWGTPSGRGDVSPTSVSQVRLVSETLRIVVDDAGDRYSVDATYMLENSSSVPVRVSYGVPLSWIPDGFPDADGDKISPEQAAKAKGLKAYPDAVEIRLDGKRALCRLEGVKKSARRPEEADGDDEALRFEAWCVTELEVPAAKSTLTLRYPGSFEFTDWATSKSPFKAFAQRRLEYLLAPAAGWAGPPDVVEIELDAGRWIEDVGTPSPPVSASDGSRLRWHLMKPDLKELSALVVFIDGKSKREFRDRIMLDAPERRVTARASSTLAPQGRTRYDAANLLDGNERTAWCAAKTESGGRPWIELKSSEFKKDPYCRLKGFTLIPGYARDQRAYRRNNRIVAVRLDKCGAHDGALLPVSPSERADEAFVDLDATEELRRILDETKTMCVRLTIEEVEQGPDKDTCVSEFRPVINCG